MRTLFGFVPTLIVFSTCAALHADDTTSPGANSVEGKWSRTIETNNGSIRMVKEHHDGNTTLEIFDEAGNLLAGKTSDYDLTETPHVRIFTFYNNVVTSGPDAGAVSPDATSYVYRIEGDRFIEVRGLLKNADDKFDVIIWERVRE